VKHPVDRQLVEKAAAGCAAAFAALLESHYDAIYRMAWRWLGMREEAEDVAQEVLSSLQAPSVRSGVGRVLDLALPRGLHGRDCPHPSTRACTTSQNARGRVSASGNDTAMLGLKPSFAAAHESGLRG
jgi:hypothetical protein